MEAVTKTDVPSPIAILLEQAKHKEPKSMIILAIRVRAFFRGGAWDATNTQFPQRQNLSNLSREEAGEEMLLYLRQEAKIPAKQLSKYTQPLL